VSERFVKLGAMSIQSALSGLPAAPIGMKARGGLFTRQAVQPALTVARVRGGAQATSARLLAHQAPAPAAAPFVPFPANPFTRLSNSSRDHYQSEPDRPQ
jgi:hypothetical protein